MTLLLDFATSPSGSSKLVLGGCLFYNDVWQEAVVQIHSQRGVFGLTGLQRPKEAVITDEGFSVIPYWLSPALMNGPLSWAAET